MTTPNLLATLFELLLAKPDVALDPALALAMEPLLQGGPELAAAVELLAPHRVLPLLDHQLSAFGFAGAVAPGVRDRLGKVHGEVRELNRLLFLSATLILRAAEQRCIRPVVLKGLLFADSYYPEFDTRPMGDIDLVSAPGESQALHAALAQAGFVRVVDHVLQDHAIAFENRDGVSCDAHSYLEMYPDADWATVTREASLRRVRGLKVRILEPNRMVAHLVEHMHGHTRDVGLVLLWLLDVAFVLRRHADELDADAMQAALTTPGARVLAWRIFGLLERHGQRLPRGLAPLAARIQGVPALSLESVMRARRTTPWGLPSPIGLLRVLAHRLDLRDYTHRAAPLMSDLWRLPCDIFATRIATEIARYRHR
jgi:hypothetical protein